MRRTASWTAVGLLALGVCAGALHLADTDPEVALKDLNTWYSEQFAKTRTNPPTADRAAILKERVERAKKAVEGLEVANVDAAKCLALAQLYQAGNEVKLQEAACERFLSSSPAPEPKYNAQSMLLSLVNRKGDAARLKALLAEIKPPSPSIAMLHAIMVANQYSDTLAAKLGADEALAAIKAAGQGIPPAADVTTDPDKQRRDQAVMYVGRSTAELLSGAGKKPEALAAIDGAKAQLSAGSTMAKQFDSLTTQIKLPGTEAPALVQERGYGDYGGLESYRGKVVLLDFFAHWCPPCKRAFPDMKKMYAELHSKGLEIVGLTTYYGYYEQEGRPKNDLPKDTEFAKMKDFIALHSLPWPVAYVDRAAFGLYGVSGIPHYVILDQSGKVRHIEIGYTPEKHEKVRKMIEGMLSAAN